MSDIKFNEDSQSIIATIQDSVKTERINVKVGDYTTRPVNRVPELSHSVALSVASLTGLIGYIERGIDGETRKNPFVRVVDEETVHFHNDIAEDTEKRFTPILATAITPTLKFDTYLSKEEAHIMLQSRFVETEERNILLEQLGLIVADEELQQEDDGVTQRITMQQGIRRSEAKIINPVNLRPYRTFTEIEQPLSPFIVRLRSSDDKGIQVALFEADGGAWRNVARQSIKRYLEMELVKGQVPVIA